MHLSRMCILLLLGGIFSIHLLELDFCLWHEVWVQLHFFAYGYPFFTAPFAEEIIFSPLNDLGNPWQKSIGHIFMGIFLLQAHLEYFLPQS